MNNKALWMLVPLICVIAFVVACWPIQFSAVKAADAYQRSPLDEHSEMAKLVGSWLVTTTVVKQDATFPSLLTFTSDGIVLADEPPSPFETTGHGAWEATGKDSANFTFIAFIGSESGALSVTLKVMASLVYDADVDTWQGPFTIRITDADGAEVLVDDGTFDATRITVEAPGTTAEESLATPVALQPGDKIGEMVLSKGPDPFDLNIPPYIAFCNGNPMVETGSNVGKPGAYTVECSIPVLPQLMIGFGWVTDTKDHLEEQWSAITTELYVNDQPVDQATFGSLDATVPVSGIPGEDPDKVVEVPLRTWNVMLENLQAGPLELRVVWNVAKDASDNMSTTPAGVYDITYKITVDPSLAAAEGEPAPVDLIPELVTVFDNFNAAVNTHDVDQQLSFFADDAVASFPNQPEPNRYVGKDEIRTWLETDANNNIHVETSGVKTTGDTISATARLTMADAPPDLLIEGTVEATVKEGKIQTFTFTLSDETIERLKALEAQ